MSLEEADEFVVVEVQEKEEADPGYRIRAVGMCFYRPGKDLVNGRRYKLHRSPQNPKDEWCIEIKEQQRVRATLNKDISQLLAPFLDENVTSDPTCLVLQDAAWSRGDNGRPARAHKVVIRLVVRYNKLTYLRETFKYYEIVIVAEK
ncbi:hypothetical protein OS493_036200 [Desmophyllum pertusum]|uniref:Uncharacterized protein n=1 Tax=Desmophyllum pertusum TaxID=174260 RepID=A0A9W9YW38_9CNID|nr:hypothetical protein OS493_036200 [Desmophyllum pertusum]